MIHICDRDADIYELFAKCEEIDTNFGVRAVHSRGTIRKELKSKKLPEKERINWKLLTDLPVESFEQALEKIKWYQARWNIEIYFKTLKSGFGLEKSRLRHFDRIKKFMALASVIAWRVFWLTKISRSAPALPPTLGFSTQEKNALVQILLAEGIPPPKTNTIKDYVTMLATLGGYLNRNSDSPPGNIVIWRGLQRLHEAIAVLGN